MTSFNRRGLLLSGAGLIAGGLPGTAAAQQEAAKIGAAAFFKRQPLRLVVAAAAGSGNDRLARLLARHLGQRLGTTVEVETSSRGASAALGVLTARPADGATVVLVNAEAVLIRRLLVAARSDEPDVSGLHWLAGLTSAPKVWLVAASSRLTMARDALAATHMSWPALARADTISDTIAVASYAAGLKSKVRLGFANANEMAAAVLAGKADCGLLPGEAALPLIAAGKMRPLAVLSTARWSRLADVPTLSEALPVMPDRRWMLDLRLGLAEVQQALATAAGVPAYRIGYLRKAIGDVVGHPAFMKDTAAARRELTPRPGEALQRQIDGLMAKAAGRLVELRKAAADGLGPG